MHHVSEFAKFALHPLKFRLFLLSRLPSAYFAGVRLRKIDGERTVVTIPFKWFSQNPFRSTYFACLSMAAELSTGALAMAYLYKKKYSVSMLVVRVESDYFKKATGLTKFTCEDGTLFREAIEKTLETGEPYTVRACSTGKNEKGELVATFYVTWSFKARNN